MEYTEKANRPAPSYAALEGIARLLGVAAWVLAGGWICGAVLLLSSPLQHENWSDWVITLACVVAAAVVWLLFRGMAAMLTVFINIASDLRSIASR